MRSARCEQCGASGPLGEMLYLTRGPQQLLYCKTCATQALSEPRAQSEKRGVQAAMDPTVCGMCRTDYGSTELASAGGLPVCETCRHTLYNRPFPQWLKLSFVALLLLLAVALAHSGRYFRAARSLTRGERFLKQKQYTAAVPLLEQAVKLVPGAQEPILLAAKAHLLSGELGKANEVLRGRPEYEDNALFKEVNNLYDREAQAAQKMAKAEELDSQGNCEEAVATARQAASLLPEIPALAGVVISFEINAAARRADYDRFLELNEQRLHEHPQSAMAVAGVASALACKYAKSGDSSFKERSAQMLERGRSLAQSAEKEEKDAFAEYSERIEHRLRTRRIIEKDEYDRLFRTAKAAEKR